MHATVGQLLSFRDGAALEAALEIHIVECPRCRAALEDLVTLRNGLRGLRELTPPAGAWRCIRDKTPEAASHTALRRTSWATGIAASLALVVGIVLTAGRDEGGEPPPQERATLAREVRPASDDLLARSREMEAFLRRLPARPQLVRVGTAATIEELEERIRLVDYQLNLQSEIGSSQRDSRRLWEARVDLLNSLASVRYVEAQWQIY